MPKIFDVKAPSGKYTDGQGQEHTRWVTVGALFKNEQTGRISLKLEAIPATWADPDRAGWCMCFAPSESTLPRSGANISGGAPGPARAEGIDDDIPF